MSVLDRLTVAVTFDPAKGYVATIPDMATPVTALSLNGLRRRIEALLLPDHGVVLLSLDRVARWSATLGATAGKAGRTITPGQGEDRRWTAPGPDPPLPVTSKQRPGIYLTAQ